jgi:hypothetical protein
MAETPGEISNFSPDATDFLFQTLADWNEQLKHSGVALPPVPVAPLEPKSPTKPKPRTRGFRPTPSALS